jgi:hypothetical protein
MKLRSLLILLFLLPQISVSSQDTTSSSVEKSPEDTLHQDRILMMNGREIECKVTDIGMGTVDYEMRKKGKLKKGAVPMAEVFSVQRAGEEEEFIYEKDSARGNTLARSEMRYFIHGEQDAMSGFRTPLTTIGGLAIGAAGGYFLEFSVFTVTVPLVFTLGSTIPKVRIDRATVSDPAYLDREFYLKGYEREARNKRLLNALKSSAGGVVLGMALYAVLNPDVIR